MTNRGLAAPTQLVVYPDEGTFRSSRNSRADLLRQIVGWFDKWLAAPPG